MSEQSSKPAQLQVSPDTLPTSFEKKKTDTASVVRAWALVLLAVIAGGSVFLRGRRLIDNIIPSSLDVGTPAEQQPAE
ncbi:MAG: hypothetical protein AAF810_05175 [Cyanobacteria bacterium P01_D01_bin.36]